MADLDGIRQMVTDAIDQGATSVEDVHKFIAKKPLGLIKGLVPQLSAPVEMAEGLADTSIGTVYDVIRKVNEQASEIAKPLLDKLPG